jgi:dTDP-4-dehydrorhamnose 3,5-epimerase
VYLHTAAFHPGSEGALNPCDPAIGIQWPEPISEMSDRDRSRPFIDNHFAGIHL